MINQENNNLQRYRCQFCLGYTSSESCPGCGNRQLTLIPESKPAQPVVPATKKRLTLETVKEVLAVVSLTKKTVDSIIPLDIQRRVLELIIKKL